MLVSIVILNYNGKNFLRRAVESALAINWREREIVVVDNASSDGSIEDIEQAFGDAIRIVRRSVNSATSGRNDGFRAARGEIILSIDNDIVLPDRDIVAKALQILNDYPDVGILACKIGTEQNPGEPIPEHWWYPVPLEQGKNSCFYSDFFSEGAAFMRRDAVLEFGGYDEDFFWGFEAVDFAFQMLKAGREILYCPDLITAELRVRNFTPNRRDINNFYTIRNKVWTAWKHYPFWRGVTYAGGRLVTAGLRALRANWLDYYGKAVRQGVFAPAVIRNKRRPLSPAVWQRIGQIRRGHFVERIPEMMEVPVLKSGA